ncbi:unnamed protein product [Pseudo-nitzschia multistriata]|uniref:Uncharacterized protein n=1 Tax=Pseudo-nitzschia multistriata TaxID=183589 RepID=A0A448Z3F9_9STRA|nr:unnamed protein product [Pseudo-nitzschia multistriata]
MSATNDQTASPTDAGTPAAPRRSESPTGIAKDPTAGDAGEAVPPQGCSGKTVGTSPRAPMPLADAETKNGKKRPLASVGAAESPRKKTTEDLAIGTKADRQARAVGRDPFQRNLPIPFLVKTHATRNDDSKSNTVPSGRKKKKKRYSSILSGMIQSKKKETNIMIEREALRKHLGGGDYAKVDKI